MSKSDKKTYPDLPHGWEFGGPLGALAVSAGLPIVVYTMTFACNDISGCPAPSLLAPSTLTLAKLKQEVGWPEAGVFGLINTQAVIWTLAYYLFSLTLQAFLPAEEATGVKLTSGGKLKYRFNAFNSAVLTIALAVVGTYFQGADFVLWTFMWDNYIPIITTNLLISFGLAWFVYVRSFAVKPHNKEHRELAAGGHSGNLVYDWFIGRELNPRVTLPVFGTIDIKIFCELRPGLLGWLLYDLAFMARQYRTYGTVSDSMVLISVFQSAYVLDGLFMESAILTTMDITTDGFGFMLAFGDLAWVPFIYSLQARYLAVYPLHLGVSGIAIVLAAQALGFMIFRGANNEKNRFRTNPKDPKVAHLKYIETASGSKLLVSGWWGRARHINYLGDWIMAWSYCLPTGVAGYVINKTAGGAVVEVVQGEARGWGMLITYFYLVYFAVLLVHREMRDEEKCMRKYGKDWEEYRRRVPYHILPYVY